MQEGEGAIKIEQVQTRGEWGSKFWSFCGNIILNIPVYDRVGDGDKSSDKNYSLRKPRFHALVVSQLELQIFSRGQ